MLVSIWRDKHYIAYFTDWWNCSAQSNCSLRSGLSVINVSGYLFLSSWKKTMTPSRDTVEHGSVLNLNWSFWDCGDKTWAISNLDIIWSWFKFITCKQASCFNFNLTATDALDIVCTRKWRTSLISLFLPWWIWIFIGKTALKNIILQGIIRTLLAKHVRCLTECTSFLSVEITGEFLNSTCIHVSNCYSLIFAVLCT